MRFLAYDLSDSDRFTRRILVNSLPRKKEAHNKWDTDHANRNRKGGPDAGHVGKDDARELARWEGRSELCRT